MTVLVSRPIGKIPAIRAVVLGNAVTLYRSASALLAVTPSDLNHYLVPAIPSLEHRRKEEP